MATSPTPAPAGGPARLRLRWLAAGLAAVLAALLVGVAVGPVSLHPYQVLLELLNRVPGLTLHSGLSEQDAAIVWELRLPRVVLGLLVGAVLALSGGCYQGVFRNPLADPYLLGVAAGAGLGATIAVVARAGAPTDTPMSLPIAAFVGALAAVTLTHLLGVSSSRHRSTATLILAGVAVANFLTAVQTYLQQRNVETIEQVYSWVLGQLTTSGWNDVLVLLPYAVVTGAVVLLHGRELDVLSVGDEESTSLGLHPQRSRILLLAAASLGTAAAVAVSGLIGFVGLIVPHAVRLLFGSSYRVVLPLSVLLGAAFLGFADVLARVVLPPTEVPIGVVTAFFGAPFFVLVLRTARRGIT